MALLCSDGWGLPTTWRAIHKAGTGKVMEKPCPWLARSSFPEDRDQDMAPKGWFALNMESHKIAVIVRHLLRSLSSKFCADIDWLKQVTQDHIQSWLEGLQGWRLYKLSSTVLVFNQFPNKTGFPFYFDGFSCTLFCSCWLLSFTTESDSNFFTPSHQVFIYMDNISP